MSLSWVKLGGLLSFIWLNAHTLSASPTIHQLSVHEVISRDVVIIGGGSSGTYAGIYLKNRGKSIVIVERNDYLGGHAETFYPTLDTPIDYGVQGVFNESLTWDYFSRLQVPYEPLTLAPSENDYVNLQTGTRPEKPPNHQISTLKKYLDTIAQFKFLKDGVYDLPDPVPEDLLLPFGEFMEKYQLQESVFAVFQQVEGDVLKMMTLYVIQYIGIPHALALKRGYIRPVDGLAGIYTRAREKLSPDVLLNTLPTSVHRSSDGVKVLVRSSNGKLKLIQAKQLLVTIPATLHHLKALNLDEDETRLFSKWHYHSYYVGIINNSGIPDEFNQVNLDPDNYLDIPEEPMIWRIDAQVAPGYHTFKIVGNETFSAAEAYQLLMESVERLGRTGVYPDAHTPEVVRWGSHTPLTMSATADDVRDGFYRQLYALQGRHNTFWTGQSWCSGYSSLIWRYTNRVLEQMDA